MSHIPGPDHRVIRQRGDEFGAVTTAAVRDTLRAVTARFNRVVTLDDLGPIMHEWTKRVDADLLTHVGQSYIDSAKTTRAAQRDALIEVLKSNGTALTAAAEPDDFEIPLVSNQQAQDLMADARNRLVNVGNDVWEEARGELLDGLQDGDDVKALTSRVMSATDLAAARAETIARTEIAHAMCGGALAQMQQIGAQGMTKEWLAVDDSRTRPEHAEVNGEKVGINDTFSIGEEPGDAPNCRCTYGFDLPDDQLADSACGCGDAELSVLASALTATGILDLGDDLGSVCACETGPDDAFASADLFAQTQQQAAEKIASAPVPSEAAIRKAQEELQRAKEGTGRAGGDSRGGSAADRRKQRRNLFTEFGGDDRGYIVCHGCGTKVHWADPGSADNPLGLPRFERGKIFVKCQGGGYQLKNLLPECFGCNRSRNDTPIRSENRC